MNINIKQFNLEYKEEQEINELIKLLPKNPESKDIWLLQDYFWDLYKCNAKIFNEERYGAFYSHPVWKLTSLFAENDNQTKFNRSQISKYLKKFGKVRLLDFGGGFGGLARSIASKNKLISVDVYEKYPNKTAIKMSEKFKNISFKNKIENEFYEVVISTDVIEHVHDPILFLRQLNKLIKVNGYLILAACFMPVCKCHLPKTFHLRYTLKLFCRLLGLKYVEKCAKSHANVYQKIGDVKINKVIIFIFLIFSRTIFFFINPFHGLLAKIKKILKRL